MSVVGGFEGFAFGLGGGAGVDLGGGQVDVAEDVADVGQRNACVVEVHGFAVAQDVRAEVGVGERRVAGWAWYLPRIQAIPPRLSLAVLVEEHRVVIMAGGVQLPCSAR